jgi:hypothetical protein
MMHWYAELLALGCSHAIGVLNPPLLRWLTGHGFRAVGQPERDPGNGLPFIPVVLDVAKLSPVVERTARKLGPLSRAGVEYPMLPTIRS